LARGRSVCAASSQPEKETIVVPILLWFLGIPGIIILLLLLGVISF
jgi:hypothetical protein